MTSPKMVTITELLERSLQNCSLNSTQSSSSGSNRSFTSDSPENHNHDLSNSSNPTLELNSQISLPYQWEQCLDLKTGEIYYKNWRSGMKAKDDPRTTADSIEEIYSEDDSYDSEGSSSSSSSHSSSREPYNNNHQRNNQKEQVLVVAGCKTCLMYFMVPKEVDDCPKCCGQLLHFDRSDNNSP